SAGGGTTSLTRCAWTSGLEDNGPVRGGEDEGDTVLQRAADAVVLPGPGEFRRTSRYAPVRPLGEGGFGVVYEVEDRAEGGRLALKLLRFARADWLYRFKREFRTLSQIR